MPSPFNQTTPVENPLLESAKRKWMSQAPMTDEENAAFNEAIARLQGQMPQGQGLSPYIGEWKPEQQRAPGSSPQWQGQDLSKMMEPLSAQAPGPAPAQPPMPAPPKPAYSGRQHAPSLDEEYMALLTKSINPDTRLTPEEGQRLQQLEVIVRSGQREGVVSTDPQDYGTWNEQIVGKNATDGTGETGLPTPFAVPDAWFDQPSGPSGQLQDFWPQDERWEGRPGLSAGYGRSLQPIAYEGSNNPFGNIIIGPWNRRGLDAGGGGVRPPEPAGKPQAPKPQAEREAGFAAQDSAAKVSAQRTARQAQADRYLKERARPREAGPEEQAAQGLKLTPPAKDSRGYIQETEKGSAANILTNPVSGASRIRIGEGPGAAEIPFPNRAAALRFLKNRKGDPITPRQAKMFSEIQRERLGVGRGKDPFDD